VPGKCFGHKCSGPWLGDIGNVRSAVNIGSMDARSLSVHDAGVLRCIAEAPCQICTIQDRIDEKKRSLLLPSTANNPSEIGQKVQVSTLPPTLFGWSPLSSCYQLFERCGDASSNLEYFLSESWDLATCALSQASDKAGKDYRIPLIRLHSTQALSARAFDKPDPIEFKPTGRYRRSRPGSSTAAPWRHGSPTPRTPWAK